MLTTEQRKAIPEDLLQELEAAELEEARLQHEVRQLGDEIQRTQRLRALKIDGIRTAHARVVECESAVRNLRTEF